MLKLTALLPALIYGYIAYRFSAWRSARELEAKSTLLREPVLMPLIDQLAAALEIRALPVYVYEVPQINGLATKDGRIYITRGFLNRLNRNEVTPEEIAGVIAHEFGHVALGHAKARMGDFFGQNAMHTVLAALLNRLLFGFGDWAASKILAVRGAHLSRRDEFEADAYAASLMAKAGFGVEPLAQLFERLDTWNSDTRKDAAPAWLMSHPEPLERAKAVRKLARGWAKFE